MEVWAQIPDIEGYSVSNYGRVLNDTTQKLRKIQYLPTGYAVVMIRGVNLYVHRLVASVFVSGFQNGLDVNHKDGRKANNKASNLEWVSRSQNIQHAYDTGLRERKAPKSAGKNKTQIRIIETGEVFESQHTCAAAIGGQVSHINSCLKGNRLHHLGLHFEYV